MKFKKLENIALGFTVVCSLLISWAAALSIVLLMGLLSELVVWPLHAQTKPAVELEAAMAKEQVNGDLKAAIAAYQKIAADAAAPRDVRAKALLHLAGCYEKLGQEAQKVYQQIVRDFADQPAAAQARTRLTALQQANRASTPAAMTQRKIDTLEGANFGPEDTDGRRVVYWSDATSELIYRDMVTGTKRVVFKLQPNDAFYRAQPSKDFSMVYILFSNKPSRLAVIKTDGTGYRELIRDDSKGSVLGDQEMFAEWSWDNRYLLFGSRTLNRLLVVTVANGERRELVTLKTGRLESARFSPDGRFVAYRVVPGEPPSPPGSVARIFALPSQGGEPHLLYEEPASEYFRELDWTADGRYLAIASMRRGKAALNLLPVKDGQTAGTPVFVRYGNIDDGYTTSRGAFIYRTVKPGGYNVVHVASLDSNGRPGNWQRLELRGDSKSNPSPHWSPDGKQIVYSVRDDTGGQAVVRNVSTGEEREVYHGPVGICIWAAQQTKIFCTEDRGDKPELLSIAADSGESERLGPLTAGVYTMLSQSSRDGRAVYYWNLQSNFVSKLVRREIATGLDTAVTGPEQQLVRVSSDERWLYQVAKRSLEIRPLAGGDWKVIATLSEAVGRYGDGYGQFDRTPDGNWILYHDSDSAGNPSLFRVPTAGGDPERLGAFPVKDLGGTLRISPDGRKLIVASWNYANAFELWSLENFVPPAPKN